MNTSSKSTVRSHPSLSVLPRRIRQNCGLFTRTQQVIEKTPFLLGWQYFREIPTRGLPLNTDGCINPALSWSGHWRWELVSENLHLLASIVGSAREFQFATLLVRWYHLHQIKGNRHQPETSVNRPVTLIDDLDKYQSNLG